MIFVEPCSGAAAVTLRLLGGRPLVPYIGGKARYADAIISAMGLDGARIDGIVLNDPGPWGTVWLTLAECGRWDDVAAKVEQLGNMGLKGKALFDDLVAAPPPDAAARVGLRPAVGFTAVYLLLQSAAARGRPVTLAAPGDGVAHCPGHERWKTEGYGHLSRAAVASGFKERLRPDLLARRIRAMGKLPWPRVRVITGGAIGLAWPGGEVAVYVDPPYMGTIGYQHDLPREDVCALADTWRRRGAAVVAISEAEPVASAQSDWPATVRGTSPPPWQGWHHVQINPKGGGTRLGRVAEWLTLSRPPMGQLALEASEESRGAVDIVGNIC